MIDFINTDLHKLSKEIESLRKLKKCLIKTLGTNAVLVCIGTIILLCIWATEVKRTKIVLTKLGNNAHITVSKQRCIPVTITVYNPSVKQCDKTPLVTANGSYIDRNKPQRWIAISQDLYLLLCGKWVILECFKAPILNGSWLVVDCTNKRLKRTVDVLISNPDEVCFGGLWSGNLYY
jgi:hypothetical protein